MSKLHGTYRDFRSASIRCGPCLQHVKETKAKLHTYILEQDDLSDDYKEVLLAIVEEVLSEVSQEKAAEYISDLIGRRIEESLHRVTNRMKYGQLGLPGETGHVRRRTLLRTTRHHRAQSTWTGE